MEMRAWLRPCWPVPASPPPGLLEFLAAGRVFPCEEALGRVPALHTCGPRILQGPALPLALHQQPRSPHPRPPSPQVQGAEEAQKERQRQKDLESNYRRVWGSRGAEGTGDLDEFDF